MQNLHSDLLLVDELNHYNNKPIAEYIFESKISLWVQVFSLTNPGCALVNKTLRGYYIHFISFYIFVRMYQILQKSTNTEALKWK